MVERERARSELQIEGEFTSEVQAEFAPVVRMMEDVLDHGEVHARWADEDRYVEVRQGTPTFDFEGEVILVDNGCNERTFTMDHLSNWEKSMNVFEADDDAEALAPLAGSGVGGVAMARCRSSGPEAMTGGRMETPLQGLLVHVNTSQLEGNVTIPHPRQGGRSEEQQHARATR